jgi:hypothetical protein
VANLPPVLLIPVANNRNNIRLLTPESQQHKGNWWQNLPPVSLIPVANLPPVSLTPVVNLDLRISPRIFENIRNDPCAAGFALLNLPKGKSLGRSKPETNSSNEQAH